MVSVLLPAGLAGFFHLVEETGLNPGLNRPGRNRFLPPEVEETGKKFESMIKQIFSFARSCNS